MIKADQASLQKLSRRLAFASKDAPKAIAQALSDVARASKTEAKKAAADVYNLPSGRILQDLSSKRDDDSVTITGARGQRGPLLLTYGAKESGSGLAVTVIKANGKKTIKSGFIENGLTGGPVSFVREGSKRKMTAGRYVGKNRQPLRALRGPSVANMLENEKVFEVIGERFSVRAVTIFSRRLQRALASG